MATPRFDDAYTRLSDQPSPTSPEAKSAPDLLLDIETVAQTKAFIEALLQHAPLAEKIGWKHLPAAAFTTFTCSAGSVLYALGGSKLGLKYTIGGVGVNIPQNALYGFGTWEFFSHFYANFKSAWKSCLSATALGVTATLPSTFATWKLSDQGAWGYVQTGLTFAGNLPGNIYGMYDAIKRPINKLADNPRLREFLLDEFRNSLPEEYHSLVGTSQRGTKATVASYSAGGLFGSALAASLTGYVCSSAAFASEYLGKVGGTIAAVFTNSPTVLIAILVSGIDLAEDAIDLMIALYKHATGDEKLIVTAADKKYMAAYLVTVAGFTYLDVYSGGTSQTLFDSDCPSFGEVPSDILRRDVIQGTEMFNEILMAIAFYKGLNHLKQAYDTNPNHQKIERIRNVAAYLKKGSIKELEAIAMTHFADRIAEWKKPEPVVASNASFCSRLCFWKKASDPSVLAEMNDEYQQSPVSVIAENRN
jgi:hypothetical protein